MADQTKPATGASEMNNKALLQNAISGKTNKKSLVENVYLLLVVSSGLVFVIVSIAFTFLLVIPKINSINEKREKIKQQQAQYQQLLGKRDKLAQLDRTQLDTDLNLVNRSIPSNLDLSVLASLVNDIAKKHSLEVRTLSIDEQTGDTGGNLQFSVNNVEVKTLVGPFAFAGTKQNIAQFLRDWYNSDYALRFSEIRLVEQSEGQWQLDLRVLGYSMPLVKNVNPDTPLPTIDETQLQELKDSAK